MNIVLILYMFRHFHNVIFSRMWKTPHNFKYIKPKMIDSYMLKNDKLMQVNMQG